MSLFSSLQVSASGMAAQRTRAELLVENMANAETTRTPGGRSLPPQGRGVFERAAELAIFGGVSERACRRA